MRSGTAPWLLVWLGRQTGRSSDGERYTQSTNGEKFEVLFACRENRSPETLTRLLHRDGDGVGVLADLRLDVALLFRHFGGAMGGFSQEATARRGSHELILGEPVGARAVPNGPPQTAGSLFIISSA